MAKSVNFKNKVLFNGKHAITLDYGYTYSNGDFHKGVDLVTGINAEDYVCAIEDGIVVANANNVVGTNKNTGTLGMGNYVIIQHDNGWKTRYQHMKHGSVIVHNGQTVKKGQKLGLIGNTGYSSGRHLHFDISNSARQSNSYVSGNRYYVDPKPFLYGTRSIKGASSKKDEVIYDAYKLMANVNVRKGAGTKYAKLAYKDFTDNAKSQIQKLVGKSINYFPKGMVVSIGETKGEWGKTPSGWICLSYAEKI